MMAQMFFTLTSLRQAGKLFLTVVLIITQILLMVNILQNMYTTTTYTLMSTKNLASAAVKRLPDTVNGFLRENSRESEVCICQLI